MIICAYFSMPLGVKTTALEIDCHEANGNPFRIIAVGLPIAAAREFH